MDSFSIVECTAEYETIKELFLEYSQIQGAESCFVSFDRELADLALYYAGGALLIGYAAGVPAACAALKKTDGSTGEIKRLYVRPEFRGRGYARRMLDAVLEHAGRLDFDAVTLTTKPAVMRRAYELYGRMGFLQTGEQNGTVSMCLKLQEN